MSPLLQSLITLNNPQSPEHRTFSSYSHNRAATIFTRLREEVDHVSDTSSAGKKAEEGLGRLVALFCGLGCWLSRNHACVACLPLFGALCAILLVVLLAFPYPGRSVPATCLAACLVAPLRALSVGDVGP
ncbi:hypothetical protein LR48_Vigan1041s000200 [Vigna angularis]|uniref:Uncharacterized protein n=1 Tax=Phaseolus angularis TaxID=3914 RepID=A0A0L9THW9_PHAAN|nr:hypothetical protein LR48_Vigan1041s000200 [Vigna angularis]